MAPRAYLPTPRPTMTASTTPNTCSKTLWRKMGAQNRASSFQSVPPGNPLCTLLISPAMPCLSSIF